MTPKVRVSLHRLLNRTMCLYVTTFFRRIKTLLGNKHDSDRKIRIVSHKHQDRARDLKKSIPLLNQFYEFYKKGGVQISLYGKLVSLLKLRGAPK